MQRIDRDAGDLAHGSLFDDAHGGGHGPGRTLGARPRTRIPELLRDHVGVSYRDGSIGRSVKPGRDRTGDLVSDLGDPLPRVCDALLDPVERSLDLDELAFKLGDAGFDGRVCHAL